MVAGVAKRWSKLHLWEPDASELIAIGLEKPKGPTILIQSPSARELRRLPPIHALETKILALQLLTHMNSPIQIGKTIARLVWLERVAWNKAFFEGVSLHTARGLNTISA